MSPIFEGIAVLGTTLSVISKWLLGNKNVLGWAFAVASAACWVAFSLVIDSKVMLINNALCLALVVRGCWKWRNQ